MTRTFIAGLLTLGLAGLSASTAEACHSCKRTPCVAPQPAYQCITEMVPYTVMKTVTKVDYVPQTCTVMTREPVTNFVTKTCTYEHPVYETSYVQRRYTVTRPVYETNYVTQNYTVCRPVTTTRQVTEYCMQPTSWTETVPVMVRSGGCCGLGLLCGKLHGNHCGGVSQVGCQTVTRTCYTPVPVTRDVVETQMVAETQSRQVPVTSCRLVCEEKVDNVPVTRCRMVTECRTVQVPVTTFRCVPKTITKMVPVKRKECVPVTCYRKVKRMVPVCPAPVAMPVMASAPFAAPMASEQFGPAASMQTPVAASIQGPPPVPQK